MPWFFALPSHLKPWYCVCKKKRVIAFREVKLQLPGPFYYEKLYKKQIYFQFSYNEVEEVIIYSDHQTLHLRTI